MPHTRGPWKIAGKSGNTGEALIIEAEPRTIAWTANSLSPVTAKEEITEEDLDNARLIAAAPDMYEALRMAKTALYLTGEPLGVRGDALEFNEGGYGADAATAVRKAIAKAEGL